MTWLWSVAGGLLLAVVLWDVFRTLWYPSGQGRLSHTVMSGVWRLTRGLGPRARRLAGPVAMLAVIGSWGVLTALGGALLYWPHLPGAFSYDPGLVPGADGTFLDALYLSLVTLATLGFGDVVPTTAWLRVVAPLEALIGFALLTAAVTWILQVYPALTRSRTAALQLTALREAGTLEALGELSATTAARVLDGVGQGLTQVRVDLTQYTETYYFQEQAPSANVALTVGYAHELAEAGKRSPLPDVRHAAQTLSSTLDDFAGLLDAQFNHTGASTPGVLAAYAADQGPGGTQAA